MIQLKRKAMESGVWDLGVRRRMELVDVTVGTNVFDAVAKGSFVM